LTGLVSFVWFGDVEVVLFLCFVDNEFESSLDGDAVLSVWGIDLGYVVSEVRHHNGTYNFSFRLG
jgi:hypothetical protein